MSSCQIRRGLVALSVEGASAEFIGFLRSGAGRGCFWSLEFKARDDGFLAWPKVKACYGEGSLTFSVL